MAQKEARGLSYKILQHRFYTTIIFKHPDWLINLSSQSECLKNQRKIYAVKCLQDRVPVLKTKFGIIRESTFLLFSLLHLSKSRARSYKDIFSLKLRYIVLKSSDWLKNLAQPIRRFKNKRSVKQSKNIYKIASQTITQQLRIYHFSNVPVLFVVGIRDIFSFQTRQLTLDLVRFRLQVAQLVMSW